MAARDWDVYLIQHTHTDIGYTRPQAEILAEHLRYIDYVIEYCEKTRDYPEPSRFRWTCESAWVVARYLQSRPASQVRRLKECIAAGQVEVTAMCFNMAEVADANTLRYSLESLRALQTAGIYPQVAMQDDVNGIAWCFADYFPALGVKYLWMGEHEHKAYLPFDKPTVFNWLSSSGSGMVAYRSDHYMTANFMGIEKLDAGLFEEKLNEYLASLDRRGYPYDAIAIQYSGAYTDNAPPFVAVCDFIRTWNESHTEVRLRSALPSEFLDHIVASYPDSIKGYAQAYPDWWTDGFGSAARETAVARVSQADINSVQGLFAMGRLLSLPEAGGVKEALKRVHENLLFYDEHTFGASESVSDPLCWNSQMQWMSKASYAWDAQRRTRLLMEDAASAVQPLLRRDTVPTLTLFNTLAWERGGWSDVFIDYAVVPRACGLTLVDEEGRQARCQTLSFRNDGRMIRVWSDAVPSLGYRTYSVLCSGIGPDPSYPGTDAVTLSGDFYSLTVDPSRAGVTSLRDLRRGKEMVRQDASYALGNIVFETLSDRWDLAWRDAKGLHRQGLDEVRAYLGNDGPVFSTLIMEGRTPAAETGTGRVEFRLYKQTPVVEIVCSLRLKRDTSPSSVYVPFPLDGTHRTGIHFDVQGGDVRPGVDQIAGTASTWNTCQNYVSVSDGVSQSILGFIDTPIFQLGDLMQGPFQYEKEYDAPDVYSWVTNNYWTTNFKADQEGDLIWTYHIRSADADALPLRESLSWRTPFVARVMPAGAAVKAPAAVSVLSLDNEMIIPFSTDISDDGKSVLLHLQSCSEAEESFCAIGPGGKRMKLIPCDALGHRTGRPAVVMKLSPRAEAFFLIKP